MYENGNTTPCPKAVLQANDTLLLYFLKNWWHHQRTEPIGRCAALSNLFYELPTRRKLAYKVTSAGLRAQAPWPLWTRSQSRTSLSDPIGSPIHSVRRLDPMNHQLKIGQATPTPSTHSTHNNFSSMACMGVIYLSDSGYNEFQNDY